MAMSIVHLIGKTSDIKHIKDELARFNINPRISRNAHTIHIFVELSKNIACTQCSELKEILSLIRCNGCDRCQVKKTQKGLEKYIIYPPMILLPTNSNITEETKESALEMLSKNRGCTHVAINSRIAVNDIVRSPHIMPLIGDFGQFFTTVNPTKDEFDSTFWVTCTQNGIFQTWAPMYTMFSRGNITEKKRVLTSFCNQNAIEGSTVIDLYCGIGYFTFPYAKNRPKRIYCWEINPWSVEGFMRAAKVNKIKARVVRHDETFEPRDDDRIVLFAEDNSNAINRLSGINLSTLSHINMGLLPNAHKAVPIALKCCDLARSFGAISTIIHLHENIRQSEIPRWKDEFSKKIGRNLHVETIKRYSPGVIHVCGDFEYTR